MDVVSCATARWVRTSQCAGPLALAVGTRQRIGKCQVCRIETGPPVVAKAQLVQGCTRLRQCLPLCYLLGLAPPCADQLLRSAGLARTSGLTTLRGVPCA